MYRAGFYNTQIPTETLTAQNLMIVKAHLNVTGNISTNVCR